MSSASIAEFYIISAVVFPTLWEYLQSLGIEESKTYYLGVSIAALSVTDMFFGFAAGRLADKWTRVSLMLMGFMLFAIVASALYLVARSNYFLVNYFYPRNKFVGLRVGSWLPDLWAASATWPRSA